MPPKGRASKRQRASTEETSSAADITLKSAFAHASSVVAGLQLGVASLADRINSLNHRFGASLAGEAPQLAVGLSEAGRNAVTDCGVLASHTGKAWEGNAEEARVRGAQLAAYATLLEREAEDGEEREVTATARTLLSFTMEPAPRIVAITWGIESLWVATEAGLRLRDRVEPLRCIVSGDGIAFYLEGECDNEVSVCALDDEGNAVDSIQAEDVSVTLSHEGASVTHVAVRQAGVVQVLYRMREGSVDPVTVRVSVCGVTMPGSPYTATCPLGDSAVLASVARERVAAFLRELDVWLPSRAYTLLYRGSRDGMTAAAFHGMCDGKGPTLVLVRCEKGWVFGGYAGASWESPTFLVKFGASPDAFVLSVVGPYSTGPVRFPVVSSKSDEALWSQRGYGPGFNGGLTVKTDGGLPSTTAAFNEASYCDLGSTSCAYQNVLGKGDQSLTGSHNFTPKEVEVFAVTPV